MPYAIRLDRHAAAGLSDVSRPQLREASRICAFVSRASRSGVIAPRSKAARMPGRKPHDRVVRVRPGGDRLDAELVRDRLQRLHQFGLAEVAPVARVGLVALAIHLVRVRRDVAYSEAVREVRGGLKLGHWQARAHSGRSDHIGRSPIARAAAASRKAESAPPLNATTRLS